MAQAQDNLQIGNDTRPIVSKGMGTQEDVSGTGTASQSYTQGSYFVGNDGFMYQADSAIAQNATIIPSGTGKNCTKTDIAAELGSVKEALTNLTTDVAPIENGTNYSTSYSKGEQFIRNGLLYEVTAATVSSSTAINTGSGGNATLADCVTKTLTKLGEAISSQNVNSDTFGTVSFILYRNGLKIVRIQSSSLVSGTLIENCIPSSYMPLYNVTELKAAWGGTSIDDYRPISLMADGRIQVGPAKSSKIGLDCLILYI